jgi:hypothetical protein
MNKPSGKNSLVDANGIYNYHCECDNLNDFFPLDVAFTLNSILLVTEYPEPDEPFTLMCDIQRC